MIIWKGVNMNNEEFINNVRDWLIENIFRNGMIMFDDNVRNSDGIDLAEVIASLYEIIHMMQFGKEYDYMFHWANKCGSWVESDMFFKMFLERKDDNG